MGNPNTAKEFEKELQRAARPVRDATPGVLETDGIHDRHTGYDGVGHREHKSVNPHPQGSGPAVVPMFPGVNSG